MARIIQLPPQKLRFKEKNEEWRKLCVDKIDGGISFITDQEVRRSIAEKYTNGKLYDGVLDMKDVIEVISTDGTLKSFVPKKIQHKPIMRPKIELLVGEAAKEPFDVSIMVTDPTSISEKQEQKKTLINEKVTALLESQYSDEELKSKLKELDLYFKYTWKDMKEVNATKLFNHFFLKEKMEEKFNECMIDRLVYGEEIMMFDIVSGVPVARKLDPKRVHTLYSSNSNRIADADIIIIEEYWSKGRLIDHYYDKLTPEQVDKINANTLSSDARYTDVLQQSFIVPDAVVVDGIVRAGMGEAGYASTTKSTVDIYGNIRHLTALWRSQKLIKIVTGTNPDTGDQYERIMSEEYTPNILYGEKVAKVWVEEWWQGRKIGNDVYVGIEPRSIQFNVLGNPSKGHPGVVGYVNSISEGKVVSFLSKMKPYQYLYDIVWDRLMDGIKKNLGKILEVDLAKIPKDWTVERWMMYAYKGGIAFTDGFKEANKGVATGKLAGNLNTTNRVLDMDTGNYIQQQINLLDYIKSEMSDIVGITPQRQGAVQTSATVGGTERSVMASNNNTYYEFYQHQLFKLECCQILIETAKVALRGNKMLAQVVLNDFSTEVLDLEGNEFADSEYGIFLTTSKKANEMKENLHQFAHAFMQNNGSFSTIMDIMFSDSLIEKRRKIELAEYDMQQQASQAQEQQNKIAQEQIKEQSRLAQEEKDLRLYEIDSNNATKILIEEMKLGMADKQLDLDETVSKDDLLMRIKELQAKIDIEHKKVIVADKKASITKTSRK
jgi:hypothetical protein